MIDTNLHLSLDTPAGDSSISHEAIANITPGDCKLCKRCFNRTNVVSGSGSYSPSTMFVGLQPTKDDDQFGQPYMGERGLLLDRILEKAGLPKREMYFTYLTKCHAKGAKKSAKPRIVEQRACYVYLEREIKALKPKIVIVEGSDMLKFLVADRASDLKLMQGSLLRLPAYPGVVFVPIFSIDAVYADYNYESHIVNILRRAVSLIEHPNATPTPTSYIYTDNEEQLDKLLELLKDKEYLTLDIESDGKDTFMGTRTVCWGVGWGTGRAAYFPWLKDDNSYFWDDAARPRIVAKWNAFLKGRKLILHNGKYDLKILRYDVGLTEGIYYFDTVISSNLIDETQMSLKLKNLAWRWTDMGGYDDALEKVKKELGVKHDYSKIPREILKSYVCADCDCTYRIFEKQHPILTKDGLDFLMQGIYMPVSSIFMKLEYDGVKVDLAYLAKIKQEYEDKIVALSLKIQEVAGYKFSVSSNKQLADVLFNKLRLPVVDLGDADPSTNKDSLHRLRTRHAVVDLILEYRGTSTLLNNFILTLLRLADSNGFVHTSYNVGGQSTSRTSSSKPNLQNLPRTNKDIKKAFITRPGYTYYEFDFSQIEIRVLAQLSKDARLIADLRSGYDIHRMMAATVYGVSPEQVTDEMRTNAKSVSFGIIYGMSWKTLATNKGMTLSSARKLYDNFFSNYVGVAKWIEDVKDFARQHKCVYTPFNRIRHLDSIDHPISSIRARCERCAVNSPIQSMGADIPNLALIKLIETYPMEEFDYRLCFQIHDAVVLELNTDKAEVFASKVKRILEHAEPLCVPTPVGCKRGPSLGEVEEIEEVGEGKWQVVKK